MVGIQYDVVVKNRKTGEGKLLPESAYDTNQEDLNLEFDYLGRIEIKTDGSKQETLEEFMAKHTPPPAPIFQSAPSQAALDELIKLREQNRALKAQLEYQSETKPKKATKEKETV